MESELEYENRDHDKIREPRQFDRRDRSVRDLEQVNERSRKGRCLRFINIFFCLGKIKILLFFM